MRPPGPPARTAFPAGLQPPRAGPRESGRGRRQGPAPAGDPPRVTHLAGLEDVEQELQALGHQLLVVLLLLDGAEVPQEALHHRVPRLGERGPQRLDPHVQLPGDACGTDGRPSPLPARRTDPGPSRQRPPLRAGSHPVPSRCGTLRPGKDSFHGPRQAGREVRGDFGCPSEKAEEWLWPKGRAPGWLGLGPHQPHCLWGPGTTYWEDLSITRAGQGHLEASETCRTLGPRLSRSHLTSL